jgi:nucleotide-binding universal stress UspA family protein
LANAASGANLKEIAVKSQAFLPLVTYADPNTDAVAANAATVAAGIGVDLHALAINADIPNVSSPLSKFLLNVPEMIRQAEALSRKRGTHLLQAVTEQASTIGVNVTTNEIVAPIAMMGDVAATHARYYDFSLLGWEAGNATSRMTAEAVIFGSGKPAILLPELSRMASIDHIAIAWDGSRVAARAVADARPFLERAARITVLTVLDEKPLKEKDAGERLAASLRQRGLPAEALSINAEDCPIAETLQQHAIERGCKLLVMGGYGHTRIRDFVLGGATAGVLDDLRLPILLSH